MYMVKIRLLGKKIRKKSESAKEITISDLNILSSYESLIATGFREKHRMTLLHHNIPNTYYFPIHVLVHLKSECSVVLGCRH